MKKIIASLLLILCLGGILVSCAAERYSLLYEIDVQDLTFCVRGSRSRPKQLLVKQGDNILWSEKVKISKEIGALDGNYGFEATDLNFDGHTDFLIPESKEGDCLYYVCWLYDPAEATYVESGALTGLGNVKADADRKAVFAFDQTRKNDLVPEGKPVTYESIDTTTKYVWKDNALMPEVRASITYYSAEDIYCYRVEYFDENGLLLDTDPGDEHWLSPTAYKNFDKSFLYYFK